MTDSTETAFDTLRRVESNGMIWYELSRERGIIMDKYVCDVCGYVYDPEAGDPDNGIAPGTPFEDLPEDWVCPLCAVGKDMFSKEG